MKSYRFTLLIISFISEGRAQNLLLKSWGWVGVSSDGCLFIFNHIFSQAFCIRLVGCPCDHAMQPCMSLLVERLQFWPVSRFLWLVDYCIFSSSEIGILKKNGRNRDRMVHWLSITNWSNFNDAISPFFDGSLILVTS